tara:strand:+ start:13700 stop:14881 length:1182 start_codon:yes stop_codon:yes gene_type:complete
MNLKEIYNRDKSFLVFPESKYLDSLRSNLISNYDLDPKKLKLNESTKHYDSKILNNFDYINNIKDSFNPSINLKNNSIYSVHEKKDLFLEKFKEFQNIIDDDYIVNLNTILQNSGIILEIEKNLSSKIYINNILNKKNSVFSKNFINIGENCNIIFIEKFNNEILSNMNFINYFDIKKNSKVLHLVFQDNSEQANLQYTNFVNCGEGSEYKQILFNSSNSSIRNHNYANLLGTNSRADLQGIFLANGDQIIDNKTVVNHFAVSCSSDQKYKGILTDNAKASYLSKTFVDKNAQKTEAYQLSKGILLSDTSYFHSKPELKIYADDVKCSHGSTIGPFDQNILFYCRSRGMPKNIAISLLINSFFSDILDTTNDDEYKPLVHKSINNWLNKNSYK